MPTNTPLIALDDGHGMTTAGKRSPASLGTVMRENEFNKAVCSYLFTALTRCGVTPMFTAPEDGDVAIPTRVKRARAAGVKLLISIHANAGGGTGLETFYAQGSAKGERLARLVQSETLAATGMRNHAGKGAPGYKPDTMSAVKKLGILRGPAAAGIAACLWEGGYMDTPADLAKLKDDAYRRTCAEAIARAVCLYLGTAYV